MEERLERLIPTRLYSKITDLEYLKNNRTRLWFYGLLIRIVMTPINLIAEDYNEFRLPIAERIANGEVLYSEIIYNQMPLYPYLTGFIMLIVGTKFEVITAMALTLPIAIADTLICYYLFQIGIYVNEEKIGLISSMIYAFNPVSFHFLTQSNWDPVASLFVILSFYYTLKQRPYLVGILISLGFLTKEFPLFFFGFLLFYWRDNLIDFIKSTISFMISTIFILYSILKMTSTTLIQMVDNLLNHPIYQDEINSPVRDLIRLIHFVFKIDQNILQIAWAVLFLGFYSFTLYLLFRNREFQTLIDVLTLQLMLLSTFFLSIHSQFILWALPWLIWSTMSTDLDYKYSVWMLFGLGLRRIKIILLGDFLWGLFGLIIMYVLSRIVLQRISEAEQ